MHTYIHTCMHTYIHTYVHTYIHTNMHTCIHTYMHTYIHTYVRTYIRTYIHTYMHTYIHTYIRTYIHTYKHAYMHTYIHTYMHTYIHTYVHTYVHTYIRTYKHTCIGTYFRSLQRSAGVLRTCGGQLTIRSYFVVVLSSALPLAFVQVDSPRKKIQRPLKPFQEAARMSDKCRQRGSGPLHQHQRAVDRFAYVASMHEPPSINEVLCGWFAASSKPYAGADRHPEDGRSSRRPALHMSWLTKGHTQNQCFPYLFYRCDQDVTSSSRTLASLGIRAARPATRSQDCSDVSNLYCSHNSKMR